MAVKQGVMSVECLLAQCIKNVIYLTVSLSNLTFNNGGIKHWVAKFLKI